MKNLPTTVALSLSLVSAEEIELAGAAFSKRIHPYLLHLTRTRLDWTGMERSQELESGAPLWKVEGVVFLLTEVEAHPKQEICSLQSPSPISTATSARTGRRTFRQFV